MARARSRPQPPYTPAVVKLAQLHFDPRNPRFPPGLDGEDEQAVLAYMLDDASLTDLIASIAEQGYFPGEPVLICPEPELDEHTQPPVPSPGDTYHVIEGNRRLAALRLLHDPARAPARRQSITQMAADTEVSEDIPVIIFPTRNAILDYLGYRHVTGIKEWDPLAKAQYLSDIRARWADEERPTDLRSLGRAIGSNAAYVGRLLVGVALIRRVQTFLEEKGLDTTRLPFSLLTTALNYDDIVEFLGIAPDDPDLNGVDDDRLRDLVKWLFVPSRPGPRPGTQSTVLGESRNIRYLNVAVRSERAVVAMNEGQSARQAARLAVDPPRVFSEALEEGRRHLRLAQEQLPEVPDPTPDDRDAAIDIQARISGIIEAIGRPDPRAE